MSKKIYTMIALLMMLSFVVSGPAYAAVQRIAPPRLDEIVATVESDPDIAWQMFKDGLYDMVPDVIRADHLTEAQTLGHTTLSTPGFHVCYAAPNARDYVPSDAGQPDAGRPLAPLNYSAFRQAMAWAGLSMTEKELAINDIYGAGVNTAAYTIIPEALGVWHNPYCAKPGGNYTKAWEILEAAGFYVSGGLLYQPNGVVVRDTIDVLSPLEAPTSVEFCQRFVDQWNDFFDNFVAVTNCNFVNAVTPFNTMVVNAFLYRNFDVYWLCWGLSRFPDYLYDFFHSSQDFPWGYNSPGIDDPTLDAYIETVKWGLVYEDKLAAAHAAQCLLVEDLVPYIYFYHRIYWTITRDTLENEIVMSGVGADNGWTWMLMNWGNGSGGSVNYNWGVEPDNLHPGWADSAYESWFNGLLLDGLTAVSPGLEDLPWIAVDWEMETFDWAPLGIVDGTKVTFRIRDDAFWHDGWPVTVEDVKFSWEFMRNFPRYYSVYEYLMWVEIIDPNTIAAYFDITSQYIVYDLAGLGLLFPKHIYNPDWHSVIDTVTARPELSTWQDWMADYTGPIPAEVAGWAPGMPSPTGRPNSALVGSGTYYFHDLTPAMDIGVVKRNPSYWLQGGVGVGIDVPGRITPDTDQPWNVVISNVGCKDNDTMELTGVSIASFKVYVDSVFETEVSVGLSLDPWTYDTFVVNPSILNLPCGPHLVTIEVYETGDSVNPIATTYKTIFFCSIYDLNYDFYVGVDDIVRAAEAFGSAPPPFPGNERWDERADVNDDFYVGVDDIVEIAENFGGC